MTNIIKIFFSPSQTTKKVVEQIASNFTNESETYDLLNYDNEKEFSSSDIAIVGMPVFAGRIPKSARQRLSKLKGNGTKAIAIANYGNAHVSDALLELVNLLNDNSFNVVAAATTISHHSIFDGVAIGRPDAEDIGKINEFSKKCQEKIESGEGLASQIPGNEEYTPYKQLPFVISCDETLCSFCYDCISICPEQAIPDDDPVNTDLELCSRCTACINICPENARKFIGEAFETKKPEFEKANSERKEPEFYL